MEYEIHITVNTNDVDRFVVDCNEIGVKPIVIETENNNLLERQVMTSSKHKGASYKKNLSKLSLELAEKGYSIVRQKVEKRPNKTKSKSFVYYESHFRLKIKNEGDVANLNDLCEIYNWHKSKNMFKKCNDFYYQMITLRRKNCTLNVFNLNLEMMVLQLKNRLIEFDKIEIEECIFDSNECIDNNWLK